MAGRPTGVLHGLESNFHAFVGHPTFREKIAPLPLAEKVAAMRTPEIRSQILGETSGIRSASLGPIDELMKRVFPLGERPNYEPDFEDSVAGIANARGVSPLEAMYDLLIDNDGKELFYQPLGGYVNYNLDAQRMLMQHVPKIEAQAKMIQDVETIYECDCLQKLNQGDVIILKNIVAVPGIDLSDKAYPFLGSLCQ